MLSILNLLPGIELDQASAAVAAGTTDVDGAVIDMAGYESVLTILKLGAATDTGTVILKGQTGDAAGGGDMADITDAATAIVTESGGNLDSKFVCLEVHKPLKRYFRAVTDRGTANIVIESIIYVRFNSNRTPCPHSNIVAKTVYTKN